MRHAALAFPAGPVGAGLVPLRASVALFLVAAASRYPSAGAWPSLATYITAAAVMAGFYTRTAAAIAIASGVYIFLREGGTTSIAAHVLDALALAVLGPGALSVDGRLFGLRTIHLPR